MGLLASESESGLRNPGTIATAAVVLGHEFKSKRCSVHLLYSLILLWRGEGRLVYGQKAISVEFSQGRLVGEKARKMVMCLEYTYWSLCA